MRLVPDKEIYGQDYGSKRYYYESCEAHVGIHDEGAHEGMPLGLLADEELRGLRTRLHKYLDPLWQDTTLGRQAAYDWIFGELMGLEPERRHTAMLTKEECRTLTTELKMNRERYRETAEARAND